tara:strand:- start:12366 stop:13139 length:774 start_codon:yes stop_codon:yes gene_type:complete
MNLNNNINLLIGIPNSLKKIPRGKTIITDGSQSNIEHFQSHNSNYGIYFRNVIFNKGGDFLDSDSCINLFEELKKNEGLDNNSKLNFKHNNKYLKWQTYNDHRFDGNFDHNLIKENYPNLKLLSEDLKETLTLDEFILNEKKFFGQNSFINLIIRQGIPLNILKGAVSQLSRINNITIDLPFGLKFYVNEVNKLLEEKGFTNRFIDQTQWKNDENLLLKRNLNQAKSTILKLNKEKEYHKKKEKQMIEEIKKFKESC